MQPPAAAWQGCWPKVANPRRSLAQRVARSEKWKGVGKSAAAPDRTGLGTKPVSAPSLASRGPLWHPDPMSIYHARHSSIGRSTHEAGTAGAHVEYIIRRRSCDTVIGEHMPLPPIGANGPKAREWMDKQEASDRKNARVIDKLTLALPHELNAEQQVELVRNFANHVTRGKAPYLAAFHRNGKDAENQHCHLILRDRHIETGKRVWGNETVKPTEIFRLVWETQCNKALERAGVDARVDRRSLKAQGIDRDPTKHIGPTAQAIEAKGRESWKVDVIREEAEKRAKKRLKASESAVEAEQAPEAPEPTPEATRGPESAPEGLLGRLSRKWTERREKATQRAAERVQKANEQAAAKERDRKRDLEQSWGRPEEARRAFLHGEGGWDVSFQILRFAENEARPADQRYDMPFSFRDWSSRSAQLIDAARHKIGWMFSGKPASTLQNLEADRDAAWRAIGSLPADFSLSDDLRTKVERFKDTTEAMLAAPDIQQAISERHAQEEAEIDRMIAAREAQDRASASTPSPESAFDRQRRIEQEERQRKEQEADRVAKVLKGQDRSDTPSPSR